MDGAGAGDGRDWQMRKPPAGGGGRGIRPGGRRQAGGTVGE